MRVLRKRLKDNKDNSLHLGQKYASLSENCSLLGTDNVRGQISEHIFAPMATIVYIFLRQMVTFVRIFSRQMATIVYIFLNFQKTKNMLGYLSPDIICSLLGTDNVRGQISEHIFAPNGDHCLYILVPNGSY